MMRLQAWSQRIWLSWAEGILGGKSGHEEASTEVTLVTKEGVLWLAWRGTQEGRQ